MNITPCNKIFQSFYEMPFHTVYLQKFQVEVVKFNLGENKTGFKVEVFQTAAGLQENLNRP